MLPATMEDTSSSSSSILPDQTCKRFTLAEIQSATNNFDNTLIIGRGGFGEVYKCPIMIGSAREVAVKRLHSMSNQGAHEFEAEIQVLSKLRHDNLVSLLGYCNEENDMVLVYEFIPNGTLEDHLRTPDSSLAWLQRLTICIGAARGLDYLHTGASSQHGVIHRDVKSSNILLDANFDAKISDFGLAKIGLVDRTHVSTAVKGTFGYMDPCYFYTGKLTRKSDVYAFGVVLFEVLSGRKAVDSTVYGEEWGLAGWAQHQIKQGKLDQIIDPRLIGQISKKCLKEFTSIACRCLHTQPKQRPNMADVVFRLESILSQEIERDISVFDRKGFVYKLRSFIKGIVDVAIGRKSGLTTTSTSVAVSYFSSKKLRNATENYSKKRIIRQDAFGVFYKGILPDNRVVAIRKSKLVDETEIEVERLINEAIILTRVIHQNVVKLLGCCFEEEVPILVYEFISNNTLFYHLHNESGGMSWLSWENRLKVAFEAASALAYLHSQATMPIIHRDVKSANILLDENYTVKISNFGASRLVPLDQDQVYTSIVGTLGYLDPEYYNTGQLTDKIDVYSFGVVVAELITGEPPISEVRTNERSLGTYFVKSMKENSLLQIVDPRVSREASLEQLQAVAELVNRCLNLVGENRPTMREVVMELEGLMKFTNRSWIQQETPQEFNPRS